MKKFILAAALALLPTAAAHADPVRLQHLTTVVGDFQAGFVYWSQCGDFTKEKAAHPRYLANWESTFAAYVREIHEEYPHASGNDIGRAILTKTNGIKAGLNAGYKDKKACDSPNSDHVKKTIALFDSQSPAKMKSLLDSLGD